MKNQLDKMESTNSGLNNPLILSKILSYLPLNDLKQSRLVNQFWMEESQQYYKQLGSTELRLCFVDNVLMQKPEMNVCNKLRMCNSFKNIKLIIWFEEEDKEEEFNDTVKKHFSEYGSLIHSISLDITVNNVTNFSHLSSVLMYLTNVNELCLKFTIPNWDTIDLASLSNVGVLGGLRKLDIISAINENSSKVKELIKALIKMTPNITHLNLRYIHEENELHLSYLQEILDMEKEWKESSRREPTMPFRDLNHLEFEIETEKLINLSINLVQPIKEISILTPVVTKEIRSSLELLLKKNAKSLENICLNYYNEDGDNFEVIMPDLPKLRRISLAVFIRHVGTEFNGVEWKKTYTTSDVLKLKEQFLMGEKRFNKKFPKLRSLKITSAGTFDPQIYSVFVPAHLEEFDELKFSQFKKFDIEEPYEQDYEIEMSNNFLLWISKLFPNVFNSTLNKVRNEYN